MTSTHSARKDDKKSFMSPWSFWGSLLQNNLSTSYTATNFFSNNLITAAMLFIWIEVWLPNTPLSLSCLFFPWHIASTSAVSMSVAYDVMSCFYDTDSIFVRSKIYTIKNSLPQNPYWLFLLFPVWFRNLFEVLHTLYFNYDNLEKIRSLERLLSLRLRE